MAAKATANGTTATSSSRLSTPGVRPVGDGWRVIRRDVSRGDSVTNIKALILAGYAADPANVQAVFLFGHVPVPYSGNLNPDGHTDLKGAWPADVYYATTDDGGWTDSTVNTSTASDPRNRNVPGDGKFDQTEVPAAVRFQVGRVDFANLPAFPQSERDLLRRYLHKDHNYRHGRLPVERRGLIDDHFGVVGREAFAVNGWRNFAPLVGPTNIVTGDWLTTLRTQSHLWGYGCGAGTYTSASGVASTTDLVASDPRVVFTMLFGSYFGDWDSQNNLMRATLATPSYTLTCAWAGRPYWYVHHMALGETIGYSTRACQNGVYGYTESVGLYQVHVALMGDPTLRMHVVAPPSAFVIATNSAGGVDLSWCASPDSVLGYHVYRAPTAAGPFARLNADLTNGTNYSDSVTGTNTYMVRAVKLEVTPSGSYYNASQGIFQDLQGTFSPPSLSIARAADRVVLSWPATVVSLDYRLETTPSLSPPSWTSVTNAVETINSVNTVTLDTAGSASFFRLAQP